MNVRVVFGGRGEVNRIGGLGSGVIGKDKAFGSTAKER